MEFLTETWFLSLVAVATLLTALATLLAHVTTLFKREIPIQFGFELDNKIVTTLNLSTGDPAKEIFLRFYNTGKLTLSGVEIDIRFMRPLALSGTTRALTDIKNKTFHGRLSNEGPYWIHYSNLLISGHGRFDARFELNTEGLKLGRHEIVINVHTTQHSYKYKKGALYINSQ